MRWKDITTGKFFAIIPIRDDFDQWIWLEIVYFKRYKIFYGCGWAWHFYSKEDWGKLK